MLQLPNQQQLRTYMSYTDIFMVTLVWNVGVLGIVFFGLFIILLILKLYHLKMVQRNYDRLSLLTSTQRQSEPVKEQPLEQPELEMKPSRWFIVVNILTSIFFYLSLMDIALIYLCVYAFGIIGRGTSHDIMTVAVMFMIVIIPTVIWKVKTRVRMLSKYRKEALFTILMLMLWLGVCIGGVISLRDVCVCVYNHNYGVSIGPGLDFSFSTQLTRSYQIATVCEEHELCHLYTTVPEQTSTSVFINAHTGRSIGQLRVQLEFNGTVLQEVNSDPITLDNIEDIGARNIFSVYFHPLAPNTLYMVTVMGNIEGTWTPLQHTHYLTLPQNNQTQVKMVMGGDVGFTGDAQAFTDYLVQYNPHILFIGGDIAYDDGMRSCYYSWDNFYAVFEELNRRLDRLVPMVLSLGNHDVGHDALGEHYTQKDISTIPYFFLYNPQQLNSKEKMATVTERSSYHAHRVGSSLHLILDSGYIKTYDEQSSWIELMMTKYPQLYKFANYHNPIYPSCTNNQDGSNDRLVIEQALNNWTPLFEKGGVVAAFEHHTHYRKITHRINNGSVVQTGGVRYIGDGSWGVPQPPCSQHQYTQHPEWFAHYHNEEHPNHIWEITLKNNTILYEGINLKGETVFMLNQTLR